MVFLICGGFEKIKAAVFFVPQRNDTLTLARSAALGGSRHESKSVSTKYDGIFTVKKARPRPGENAASGMNYTV